MKINLTLPKSGFNLDLFLQETEYYFIDQALERTGGVKKFAAELLGIKRTTLVERLKKRQKSQSEHFPKLPG